MARRDWGIEFVKGRCKATNLCPYCRILGVVETAEMLYLDALEHAPSLWMVLTAREHLTRPDTHDHLRQLRRAAKRRWPDIEWFIQCEVQKRGALHLNLLIKGVPAHERGDLWMLLAGRWVDRVDAELVGQHIEKLSAAEAVVRYLQKELVHGLKKEQAMPIGWRGHRTSQTRGYLVRPACQMREEARASLRQRRALWRAIGMASEVGLEHDAELIEQITTQLLEHQEHTTWTLAVRHHGTDWEVSRGDRQPLVGQDRTDFSNELAAGMVNPPGGDPSPPRASVSA